MVFQQFNLIGRLDVLTNVLMGRPATVSAARALLKLWPDADKAIALAALEQFEIASLAVQRADQLSGGQQQRVAIARALVQEPDIILRTSHRLARSAQHQVVTDALQRINRDFGITVICNLHSLDLARGYCGRLIGIAAGRVVFDGTPETIMNPKAKRQYRLDTEVNSNVPARPDGIAVEDPITGRSCHHVTVARIRDNTPASPDKKLPRPTQQEKIIC